MKHAMRSRLTVLKTVLWALTGVLTVITVARFTRGLGATTNLSDATPWGLWIGLDVMAGVALAAGGFVLAATVYIFGLEKYRPIIRPAILTAFLGYVAVAVGLLYDLGLPWHIWHPLVHWQHQSVLFEVAMCVMCYLTVLALEFAPVALEHPTFDRPVLRSVLAFLKRITLPLVVAGIILSTLHQSSLGSLFLITPHRLHPLWYSPIIYILFFVSAVGLGLMMVTLESLLSGYFFRHKVRTDLLSGLGRAAAFVLGGYAVLRVGDLAVRGVLATHLNGSWQSVLFIFELAVSAVVPALLLSLRRVRSSVAGLAVCATMAVVGMVMNRIDVCMVAFARSANMPYFPSWMELGVSFGIFSVAILAFIFLAERLRVYDHHDEPEPSRDEPSYDPATLHGLMPARFAAPRRYSLMLIVAAAATVALLPEQAVFGVKPQQTPVRATRTLDGMVLDRADGPGHVLRLLAPGQTVPEGASRAPLLVIDGNRAGELALFNHQGHIGRLGNDTSCGTCHHLNMPLDQATSCFECHRDMYEPVSIFSHPSHVLATGGNDGCVQCHADDRAVKRLETATACTECHTDMPGKGATIGIGKDRWGPAAGYKDAMHGLCISCHERAISESPAKYSKVLSECRGCHDTDYGESLRRIGPGRTTKVNP